MLDHRSLCEDACDDRLDALIIAMPSPMLQLALIAMLTIVTRELTQHPVEAI